MGPIEISLISSTIGRIDHGKEVEGEEEIREEESGTGAQEEENDKGSKEVRQEGAGEGEEGGTQAQSAGKKAGGLCARPDGRTRSGLDAARRLGIR
jgi:hypothetical protein